MRLAGNSITSFQKIIHKGLGVKVFQKSILFLATSVAICPALAKGGQSPGQAQQMQAQQMQAAQAQQQAARRAQEGEFKAQQEQAHQLQAQELKAQEEARRGQEQALRVQEESARNAQMAAVKAQQQEALRAQQGMRTQQEQALRVQQEGARNQQEQSVKMQQQAVRAQAEQARAQEHAQQNAQQAAVEGQKNQAKAEEEGARAQTRISTTGGAPGFARSFTPKPVQGRTLPIGQAISMPVLEANANAQQQEHAAQVTRNLQAHLIAIDKNQYPTNINAIRNATLNSYMNNYPSFVNNRRYLINRSNTYVNTVPANEYPYWYHPEPNWMYANSFVYGSELNCNVDWLRWGWHPYYGPPPDGFVCSRDYVPTPWIYVPAYGVWRQPGLMGYASSGPPYDYTGPITVEVLEPRHVHVRDPYTGFMNSSVVNVIYMYNAYFYPEDERWGYMDRHDCFIWLNLDE
jgi:hypothetical protein